MKVIDSLEQNLQQLQKSFEEKQNQLLLEKDQAVLHARWVWLRVVGVVMSLTACKVGVVMSGGVVMSYSGLASFL